MRSDQVRLNSGITMPVLGLGTYSFANDKATTELAVHLALKMGYRHFDTAKIYGSEPALGNALNEAIIEGCVKREDVFVTSKLWGSDHHDPVSALRQTLKNLGMEYADMYLVHWPVKLKPWAVNPVPSEEDFEKLDLEATWAGMEKCLELGLCRTIGVSNFSSKKIQRLLDFASVPPAVNQVEMHPMWRQSRLREVCAEHKIHVSAYSPLGGPGNSWGSTAVVEHPIIQSIALKHKATPAQVALKWGLSKGASVIVKSFNQERMRENMAAFNLKLDDEDLSQIETLEEWKIMRGEFLINETTSPYRTLEDLWDYDI
ncbi:NADPH-dependent aldo-keto reductase, chloroplastic-like [Mangifera indica]|uniref:NADPH-dependent aldo-keto reductase, chloroplastic-like n=1 Tax=Mangifera indica TaxID=29780 RepID=UPI001CFAC381|nr:NADPH-dependent aldo-keto reductase, chloroplastic-like [Mangifera indica]